MIKWKLLISSLAFLAVAFFANPVQAYDESYLKGMAIEKAGFNSDEIVVEPKIIYSLPGYHSDQVVGNYDKKIIIIDPKLSIAGITAVFEAPHYQIIDQTKTYSLFSFKRRVGDILTSGGVDVAKEDMVNPSMDTLVPLAGNNNLIKITRVSIAEIEKFESLPCQTKKIDDPTLERGKEKVQQEGKIGKKRLLYQVRRVNGVEVSRILAKEEITEKPQDKIVKIGTKVVVLSSTRGIATATNLSNAVVSANYRKGTLIRITNLANNVTIIKTVNYTWGTAQAPDGIVLDLSWSILDELKFGGNGKGPSVLVEEIKP
jgi:hypothetical protein